MMKKYLMMGAAALAVSSAFVGCTKEKNLYDPLMNAQKFLSDYQAAFVEVFGEPAANQTWGFGTAASARMTRSGNMDGVTRVAETSTGINANANEWADKADASHGHGGWIVPDPLTETQKAVVAAYFQTHPNLDYTDPHWPNFFVQQVYKGTTGTVRETTEGITGANGSEYSSDNMNLLTVGYNEQHINNFNAGSYSGTDNNTYTGGINADGTVNVLDNGYTVNEFDEHHHADQIMLMVNIDDTGCMGYHCSATGLSEQRNDKAALVSWETIDDWAKSNYPGYDGCLNDTWNRSFVGFDLALKSLEESYAKDENGEKIYATLGNFPENLPEYAWDGEKVMRIGSAPATQSSPDLTSKLGTAELWNGTMTENNGVYTYTATGWGGFHFNIPNEDWSGYTKMVVEFADATPNSVEINVKNNGQDVPLLKVEWDDATTRFEIDLTGKTLDNVGQVWMQVGAAGDYKFSKIELIGEAVETAYYESNYILANGKQIPFLDRNTNQYAGESITIGPEDMTIEIDGKTCLNLVKFNQLVTDGYYPTSSALRDWSKWEDSDHYYSDWIVTLTKAQRQDDSTDPTDPTAPTDPTDPTDPVLPSLRVIAEDLTVGEKGDFDFNDVVFDVEYVSASQVTVTIQAAGGTLPLTVDNKEVHQLFKNANLGATTDQNGEIDTKTMINTNARRINPTSPYSSVDGLKAPVFTVGGSWSDDQDTFAEQVRDNIKIFVTKTDDAGTSYQLELKAEPGKAPGKVGVPKSYQWNEEQVYVGDDFKKFVSDPSYQWWSK